MKKKVISIALVVALIAIAAVGSLAYFTDVTDEVNNTFKMGNVDIDLDEAKVEKDKDGDYQPTTTRVKENDYTDIKMTPGEVYPKDPTIHVSEDSEESYLFMDLTLNKFSSLFWVMAADASADANIDFTIFDDKGALSKDFQNEKGVFSTTKFVTYMSAHKDIFQAVIDKWLTGVEHEQWNLMADPIINDDKTEMTFRFGYIGPEGTAVAGKDIKFMDSFQMPASVTQEMIESGMTVGKMQNNFNTENADFRLDFKAYAIQAEGFDTNTLADKSVKLEDLGSAMAAVPFE